MKIATLILTIALPAASARAAPTYTIERDRLTVTGAEIAVVRAVEPGTPEPVMVTPTPFWDAGVGFSVSPTDELAWTLVPGRYTVTAFGQSAAPGIERAEAVWEITVAEPDRQARIRRAFVAFFAAAAEWRELAPTDVELFQAVRGF